MTTIPDNALSNPYVGPRTFTYEQRDLFFGREREARDLLARVVSERLLLFYAQSGAGKSSLLYTRLIPQLREEEGYAVLPVGRVSGELPPEVGQVDNIYIFNLMTSLDPTSRDFVRLSQLTLSDFLAHLVSEDGKTWRYDPMATPTLVEQAESGTQPASAQRYALLIDQFEELISGYPGRWQEREGFFRQLNQAMLDDPNLWVVLTLREDYVAALDPYARLLTDKLRARFYMERMGYAAALEAIKQPAKIGGRPFYENPAAHEDVARDLVDNLRLVRVLDKEQLEPGQYVEPMQLQVVCFQLWRRLEGSEKFGTQRSSWSAETSVESLPQSAQTEATFRTSIAPVFITTADLETLAGERGVADFVNQALADFYEQALQRVLQTPQIKLSERRLRDWFSNKLITPEGTRGLVQQGDEASGVGGLPLIVAHLLEDQFLIRAESRAGARWFELVHDRFVQPILRANRSWFAQHINQVTIAARDREATGEPSAKLLNGSALTVALQALAANPDEFDDLDRNYLKASEEEAQREALRRRQIRTLGMLGIVVFFIIVGFAGFAVWQWKIAENSKSEALIANQQAQAEAEHAKTAEAVAVTRQGEALAAATLAARNAETAESSKSEALIANQQAQTEAEHAKTAEAVAITRQGEALAAATLAANNAETAVAGQAEAESAKNAQAQAAATAVAQQHNAEAVSTVAVENIATANAKFNADGTLVANLAQVAQIYLTVQAPTPRVTPIPPTVSTPRASMSKTPVPLLSSAIYSHEIAPVETVIAQAQMRIGHIDTRFVHRQGNQFVLGGHPFKFIGVSIRGLVHYGDQKNPMLQYTKTEDQLIGLEAASQMRARVVVVFLPTIYASTQQTSDRLDKLLSLISKQFPNIYLMPVLTDRYGNTPFRIPGDDKFYAQLDPNYSGTMLTPEFYMHGYQENYLPFVEYIVNRFKENQHIFAWQIGDEIATENPELLTEFSQKVAKRIKELDPNHLVTTGLAGTSRTEGMRGNLKERLALYNSPYIDFIPISMFNNEYDNDDSDLAQLLNKPFVLAEAGYGSALPGDRAELVSNSLQRWLGGVASGYIQWGFMASPNDIGDGDTDSGMDHVWHAKDWNALFCVYRTYAQQLLVRPDLFAEENFTNRERSAIDLAVSGCRSALGGSISDADAAFRKGIAIDPGLGIDPSLEIKQLVALRK